MLTETGYSLNDVGRSLSWGALASFLSSTKPDSALSAEINPDVAEWSTIFKTNALLADIYDAIRQFNAIMAAKGSGKRPQTPKPYPRPWQRKKRQHFTKKMKIKEWFKLAGGDSNGGGT